MRVAMIFYKLSLCKQFYLKISLLWVLYDWFFLDELKLFLNMLEIRVCCLYAQVETTHLQLTHRLVVIESSVLSAELFSGHFDK